ncbi:MAG: hypothetical protein M1335_05695, partial [Chloroflexi bacterium]|nr:hypothetical protein [Chloroflexota bacterium]
GFSFKTFDRIQQTLGQKPLVVLNESQLVGEKGDEVQRVGQLLVGCGAGAVGAAAEQAPRKSAITARSVTSMGTRRTGLIFISFLLHG